MDPPATQVPYRVLSLAGGGARGVFHSAFLQRLESSFQVPCADLFDLIAGTSTGAIVALGIAAGKPAAEITSFYRDHSEEVFRSVLCGKLRRRPRYRHSPLRKALQTVFGDMTLADLLIDVVIPATALDNFGGRIFTKSDAGLSIVDVALASSAAPTYFYPVKPQGSERSFFDGGLWANRPSLVAVTYANGTLAVPLDQMVLLSLGTGRIFAGATPREVRRLRTLSVRTLRLLGDLMPSSGNWFVDYATKQALGDRCLIIDPELHHRIVLDDWRRALQALPAHADEAFDTHRNEIQRLLGGARIRRNARRQTPLSPLVIQALQDAHVTGFMPDRRYYYQQRGPTNSIASYIQQAVHSLTIVSITLGTGIDIDGVIQAFRQMIIERQEPPRILVSLLDPARADLMASLAQALDMEGGALAGRIDESIAKLTRFRESLPTQRQSCFRLSAHQTTPFASAIIMDQGTSTGTFQFETKPYKTELSRSFALEVGAGSPLFQTLTEAYLLLVEEGRQIGDD